MAELIQILETSNLAVACFQTKYFSIDSYLLVEMYMVQKVFF